LWSGEGIFAAVSSVSNLFSFAQFAWRYSWRDEVELVAARNGAWIFLIWQGILKEVFNHVDD